MPLAHPVILRNLMKRYEALAAGRAESGDAASSEEYDDVAYLLRVATGTSDTGAALVAARFRLPGARPGTVHR